MFKSLQRSILIPQSEHLRLAGALALLWGNAQFELPPLPHLSIVAGNALHDRGYGYLDNLPIGELSDEQWIPVARKGFSMPSTDPVADLVARHHMLRLATGQYTPARQALAEEMRRGIQQQLEQNGLDAELLMQIDRMTKFCDRVSFDFCREEPTGGQVEVFARYAPAETRVLHYQVRGSEIMVDPWPFRVDEHEGYLVGYQREGYPDRLDALIVPYHLHRA